MRKKISHVLNVDDCIGIDGLWKKSYSRNFPGVIIQYHTRASVLWSNIEKRCSPGGAYQMKNKSYQWCENGFENFQIFADWCQSQYGYGKDEDGSVWHLDKDLLSGEIKRYSPDSCVFITARLNHLISKKRTSRLNGLPSGVFKSGKRFVAQISNGYGKNIYLGTFTEPSSASKEFRKAKAGMVLQELERMGHPDPRVFSSVMDLAAALINENPGGS